MPDTPHGHAMDAEQETAGQSMDTPHGHAMDTQATGHHGHGRVGLDTHPRPVSGVADPLSAIGFHRPDWVADALCKEHRHLDFTIERGRVKDEALQVCGRCAVMVECRDYAVADELLVGIWGGTDTAARRAMRHARATDGAA